MLILVVVIFLCFVIHYLNVHLIFISKKNLFVFYISFYFTSSNKKIFLYGFTFNSSTFVVDQKSVDFRFYTHTRTRTHS